MTKPGHVTYERIKAQDIRVGDRVARARSRAFYEVVEVRHAQASAVVVLAFASGGTHKVKPRLTAEWWREVPSS